MFFIGQKFAILETKTAIVKLLSAFKVSLGDENFVPELKMTFSLRFKHGLSLKFTERNWSLYSILFVNKPKNIVNTVILMFFSIKSIFYLTLYFYYKIIWFQSKWYTTIILMEYSVSVFFSKMQNNSSTINVCYPMSSLTNVEHSI